MTCWRDIQACFGIIVGFFYFINLCRAIFHFAIGNDKVLVVQHGEHHPNRENTKH